MVDVELGAAQRNMLAAVIHASEESAEGNYVVGEEVAQYTGVSVGTLRNSVQSLTALNLVESKAGQHGGYRPTRAGEEMLDEEEIERRIVRR